MNTRIVCPIKSITCSASSGERLARRRPAAELAKNRYRKETLNVRRVIMVLLAWMDDFKKDLVHALRSLRADPLFTTIAILALALGIGANTAIFSVMNAVVLRLLPVHEPERVFNLACDGLPNGASNTGDTETSFSVPVFERLRK